MQSSLKPDIIWILIDGLRPDKLRCCGDINRPNTFIDEMLLQGTLFTTMIASGAHTRTSMTAIFTSLYPSINKMDALKTELQQKLDPAAVTIMDILQNNGYKIFHWQDPTYWVHMTHNGQNTPTSGIQVYESGKYYKIEDTPNHSFVSPERDTFIEDFNNYLAPKYVFFHLLTLHDLSVEDTKKNYELTGNYALPESAYENNLIKASEDFKDVWNKLKIKEDSLIIISTDHGTRFGLVDLFKEEQRYGVRLKDISMKTFCSLIGPNLPRKIINRLVRTIDIVPTILDIINCEPILGQGVSLLPLIRGDTIPKLNAFMETGGIFEKPASHDKSNIWGVRTEKWKYWKHAWRGEWLIDLQNDPDEEINLIGNGLTIEEKLRNLVKENLILNTDNAEKIYTENARKRGISKYFNKKEIVPEISLFLLVDKENSRLSLVINSILAQAGVYFELIVIDMISDDRIKTLVTKYNDYRLKYSQKLSKQNFNSIIDSTRGKIVSIISSDFYYAPNFLYDLKKILDKKPEIDLIYSNFIITDKAGVYKFVNAEYLFNSNKNIGACFLLRRKALKSSSNFTIRTYDNKFLGLSLSESVKISNIPDVFGRSYREEVTFKPLDLVYRIIKTLNNEGWVGLLERVMGILKYKLRLIWMKGYLEKIRPSIYEVKKTILYLPNWGVNSSFDIIKTQIKRLAKIRGYNFIIKPCLETIKNERERINYFQKEIVDGEIVCLENGGDLEELLRITDLVIVDSMHDIFWQINLPNLPILVIELNKTFKKIRLKENLHYPFIIINKKPKSLIKDVKKLFRRMLVNKTGPKSWIDKLINLF